MDLCVVPVNKLSVVPDLVGFLDGHWRSPRRIFRAPKSTVVCGESDPGAVETVCVACGVSTLPGQSGDRKSTRLNSSHGYISYAVFCLEKKKHYDTTG